MRIVAFSNMQMFSQSRWWLFGSVLLVSLNIISCVRMISRYGVHGGGFKLYKDNFQGDSPRFIDRAISNMPSARRFSTLPGQPWPLPVL